MSPIEEESIFAFPSAIEDPLPEEEYYHAFQTLLSLGQSIPALGPVIVSPIKIVCSFLSLITAIACSILFGLVHCVQPKEGYGRKSWAWVRIGEESLIHFFYAMFNLCSFGIAGALIEMKKWRTVLFPEKEIASNFRCFLGRQSRMAKKIFWISHFLLAPPMQMQGLCRDKIVRICPKKNTRGRSGLMPLPPLLYLNFVQVYQWNRLVSKANRSSIAE